MGYGSKVWSVVWYGRVLYGGESPVMISAAESWFPAGQSAVARAFVPHYPVRYHTGHSSVWHVLLYHTVLYHTGQSAVARVPC